MDIACDRIGKAALVAAMTSQDEEALLKRSRDALQARMRLAITFVSGLASEVRKKFIHSVVACALQNEVIRREDHQVHAVQHAALEAFDHIASHISSDASLKMKVAVVADGRWVAVAVYGDSAIEPITNHERAALGIMHL